MSRHVDSNTYRHVSPDALFRALSGSSGPDAGNGLDGLNVSHDHPSSNAVQAKRDSVLDKSVQDAAPEEKEFGVRVANNAKVLRGWCAEIEGWDTSTAIGVATSTAPATSKWLDLPSELRIHYEVRIREIREEIDTLDIERQKEVVLDAHQGYQKVQLTGLSALITAVILNSLPDYGRLVEMLEMWDTRLFVLNFIPDFLMQLQGMKEAIVVAWDMIKKYDDEGVESAGKARDEVERHRQGLSDHLASLGRQLDAMLDTLEGRADTLPDQWIDDVDALENGFSDWSVTAEARVLEHEEQLRRTQEAKAQDDASVSAESLVTPDETIPQPLPKTSPVDEDLGGPGPAEKVGDFTPVYESPLEQERHGKDSEGPSPIDVSPTSDHFDLSGTYETARQLPLFAFGDNSFRRQTPQRVFSESDAVAYRPLSIVSEHDPRFLSPPLLKRLHRRHSSRDMDIEPLLPIKPLHKLHRRHSSREVEIRRASFASGIPMSAVRRISIVRSPSETPTASKRSSSISVITAPGSPTSEDDHWTVQRWRRYSQASDTDTTQGSPETQRRERPAIGQIRSFHSALTIEEASPVYSESAQLEGEDLMDSPGPDQTSFDPFQFEEPVDRSFSFGRPRVYIPETPDPSVESQNPLEEYRQPSDIPHPPGPNTNGSVYRTPERSTPPDLLPVSTDDQIERRIDRILHTLPTRINFERRRPDAGPSRLPTLSKLATGTPPNQSPTPSDSSRSSTPGLTLSRAADSNLGTTKSSPHTNGIRIYNLLRPGRPEPIKLFVRLVGEEGRVMVRVGGGWEDLATYLRDYSLHHSRAPVPGLKDLQGVQGVQAWQERRAVTMPILPSDVSGDGVLVGETTDKPFARRPSPRLSMVPTMGAPQTGKRLCDAADATARSASAQQTTTDTEEPEDSPPATPVVDITDFAAYRSALRNRTSSPSPGFSPAGTLGQAQGSAERKRWTGIGGIFTKGKQKGKNPGAVPDASNVVNEKGNGTRRLYKSSDGLGGVGDVVPYP